MLEKPKKNIFINSRTSIFYLYEGIKEDKRFKWLLFSYFNFIIYLKTFKIKIYPFISLSVYLYT